MSKYEVVFILDPQKVEGNGEEYDAAIQEQLKALGGEISRVKFLDKRTFARPMGKHKAGLYWDYIVTFGALHGHLAVVHALLAYTHGATLAGGEGDIVLRTGRGIVFDT